MPPSYSSQEYWNTRFQSEPEPFEWLEAPDVLDSYLHDALQTSNEPSPNILHIGCGTSDLSHHLRTIVNEPERIHNLDYSDVAIALGRKREEELCRELDPTSPNCATTAKSMRWTAVDMLNHTFFLRACQPGAYSLIVDKSTSDCIACCDDVAVRLPYTIDICTDTPTPTRSSETFLHPLHVLAVHMAVATTPGARWIALSYSGDRFPFVEGLFSSRPHLPGFPDTGRLWRLLEKREVQDHHRGEDTVGSGHWVYVMERTGVRLCVGGGHI